MGLELTFNSVVTEGYSLRRTEFAGQNDKDGVGHTVSRHVKRTTGFLYDIF